jgi:hypothetical protein
MKLSDQLIHLLSALRDVDSIVRNLRNYVAAFNSSASAIEEFEVLSDSITGAISGLQEDLITLKNLLPPSASTSIHQKVKHVYNRRKVRDVTRRLLERKNDLNLALSITGR